jgi:glycosyltransferase involved in cell wall biosynthesis
MTPELLVVMPVFNEEKCLPSVLDEWTDVLDRSGIDYRFLAIDDGSRDGSTELLRAWSNAHAPHRFEFVSQTNRGHGATCMQGYRSACKAGVPWVFQIDSDGQCDPGFFSAVWEMRHEADVVYGARRKRLDGWKRVAASILLRLVVRISSGMWCVDANVPYRLMRTDKLLPLLDSIPPGFDLANIALAVQIRCAGWPEAVVPIVFRGRAGGEPSVPLKRFAWKAAELFSHLRRLPQP